MDLLPGASVIIHVKGGLSEHELETQIKVVSLVNAFKTARDENGQ